MAVTIRIDFMFLDAILFIDDQFKSKKSMYQLNNLSKKYEFNTSTYKITDFAFEEKMIEWVSYFNYLNNNCMCSVKET